MEGLPEHEGQKQTDRSAGFDSGRTRDLVVEQHGSGFNPIVEMPEVVECVDDGVHRPRAGEQQGVVVRRNAVLEEPVCPLVESAALSRCGAIAARSAPVVKPGVGDDLFVRQCIEPLLERPRPTEPDHVRCPREHQAVERRPVFVASQKRHQIIVSAGRLEQSTCPQAQLPPRMLPELHLGTSAQHVREEGVVPVDGLVAAFSRSHQVIAAVKAAEDLARTRLRSESGRHRRTHLVEEGGLEQQVAGLRIEALQDLFCEVVEHELPRGQVGHFHHVALGHDLIEHEDEPRRPALGFLVEPLAGKLAAGVVPLLDDRIGLLPSEAQLVPAHHLELAVRSQPRHRGRRLTATAHDHASFGRRLHDRILDDSVQGRVGWDLMVVVENQHEGRGERPEEDPKVAPGEGRYLVVALGREERQGGRMILARATAHVVEESGDVGVADIELIPERIEPAGAQVARYQRRLAATRASVDPHARGAPPPVEQLEEPLPDEHLGEVGMAGLGETRELRHERAPFLP